MDALVITWRELLVVVILVLAVYVAEMLLFMRSGGQRRIGLWRRDERPSGSPKELRLLREEVADLRDEMAELRGEMEVLKSMQAAGNSPYAHAIEMAKEGHDVGEVAAACGISRGEAELVVAVHRADAP